MRNKAPLALMEQIVMVGVFALAAALCVQVFVLSDRVSRQSEVRDRALLLAQNAAEELKSVGGDFEEAARLYGGVWNGQMWGWSLDETWTAADGEQPSAYHLLVTPVESGQPLLGTAEATVYTAEGEALCSLPVAWQAPDVPAQGAEERALAAAREMAEQFLSCGGGAEAVRRYGGESDGLGGWQMGFDENWKTALNMRTPDWTYGAWVQVAETDVPQVSVFTRAGTQLAAVPLEEVETNG